MSYYFNKTITAEFDEAVSRTTQWLKNEGFGILTEIDVKATLKKKLDKEFRNYRIPGACNPPFAYNALLAEEKVGTMQAIENPKLREIAETIVRKLEAVIETV